MTSRVFVQSGLRRSGTHLFTNWLIQSVPEIFHRNNMTRPKDFQEGATGDGYRYYRGGKPIKPVKGLKDIVLAFEDKGRDDVAKVVSRIPICDRVPVEFFYIVRSFPNVMASRLKAAHRSATFGKFCPVTPKIADIWHETATMYLQQQTLDCRVFLYDTFVKSRAYRDHCAKIIGIACVDVDMDRVAETSGGSSFTKTKMKGTEMPVHSRVDQLKDYNLELPKWVMEHPSWALSEKIFKA